MAVICTVKSPTHHCSNIIQSMSDTDVIKRLTVNYDYSVTISKFQQIWYRY